MGRRSTAIKADVSRPEDVELMFQKGLQDFRRIGILVDDASIRPQPRDIEIPLDDVLCNL
jgi:NAD(P)-dependent dehydrogenase (short-subunit alcohol dehydrogenase family)